VCASKTRTEKFSGPGENCQRNVTDLAGSLITSSRPPGRPQKKPDDWAEHPTVAVLYEQLMAAGEPQMLPTNNISGVDAVVNCYPWTMTFLCHILRIMLWDKKSEVFGGDVRLVGVSSCLLTWCAASWVNCLQREQSAVRTSKCARDLPSWTWKLICHFGQQKRYLALHSYEVSEWLTVLAW